MRSTVFTAITSEGGLLPADFLERLPLPKSGIEGLEPSSYNLGTDEKLTESVSRSWNRLQGRWNSFKKTLRSKASEDATTEDTRHQWLLLVFQELGFGRLPTARAIEADGRSYAISHSWEQVPIHLVGTHLSLDRRAAGVAGAATGSPHSLLQQLLNAREDMLWGIVSNGFQLRLLRDNLTLTRQAFVEFDLQAIFDGELYPEFLVFWLVCHQSRFEKSQQTSPWLEKWHGVAQQQGRRALEHLRPGVEKAIETLGRGFIVHPENNSLRNDLAEGILTKEEFYRQILRLVYRLLFLLVAEERNLLHSPSTTPQIRQRYSRFYSLQRLRSFTRRGGSPHGDLWIVFKLVSQHLGGTTGYNELGLPPLGSFLWSNSATSSLNNSALANAEFLEAFFYLTVVREGTLRRMVDYRNLGSEELGGVYESLLEQHPQINPIARTFTLNTAAGNERKTSGSYYTPDPLVQCLLDSALEPVVENRIREARGDWKKQLKEERTFEEGEYVAQAILKLKICDPAVGSGHFLIAAAHRLAKRVATARSGEVEPSPELVQTALRDVIGRCLYGVDINPMSAELCRVSLWLEALEPGKPLSFLDHHIRVGNSLLGTTPQLIKSGLPDEAFKPISGDDKVICAEAKKRNRDELSQLALFHGTTVKSHFSSDDLPREMSKVDSMSDNTSDEIRRKEESYNALINSTFYENNLLIANAWCAAFVWKKNKDLPYPITNGVLTKIDLNGNFIVEKWMENEIQRLASQYHFFHWHLAFPEVFTVSEGKDSAFNQQSGWSGGFDVILGNPPWERVKLQEKEWFAERSPNITEASSAALRKKLIENLRAENPTLHLLFLDAMRQAEGEGHILRDSTLYPLCGRGDINLYAVFAENAKLRLSSTGRMGLVLPSGIATGDTTKFFFQDLCEKKSLVSLLSFFEIRLIFTDTDSREPFSLLTAGSGIRPLVEASEFVWFAKTIAEINSPERRFTLTSADIALLKPNTKTCPVFQNSKDAEITKRIYRRLPVLIREGKIEENPWNIEFGRMLDMANDSSLFQSYGNLIESGGVVDGNEFTLNGNRLLPMYEQNLIHSFDNRFATFKTESGVPSFTTSRQFTEDEHRDASLSPLPRYWVHEKEIIQELQDRYKNFGWTLGFRRSARSNDARTALFCALPRAAVGDSIFLMGSSQVKDPTPLALLLGQFSTFIFDFTARQSIGGENASFFIIKQLPITSPSIYEKPCEWALGSNISLREWVLNRVLELTYTSWDLKSFAEDCGWFGPPFIWNESRRFQIRCELDAAFFHLYLGDEVEWNQQPSTLTQSFGIPRQAIEHVMETFPIVKRKDETTYGSYRTKETVLKIYDEIVDSLKTNRSFQTPLAPDAASFRAAHISKMPTSARIPLQQARSYWLEFLVSVAKLSRRELTLLDLWETYLILISDLDQSSEAELVIGVQAKHWINSLKTEPLQKGIFPEILETLSKNGQILRTLRGGQIYLSISEALPISPGPWRIFDAASALSIFHSRPRVKDISEGIVSMPVAGEESTYDDLERLFA